jgi:3-oxoacyl-(acyl-carrier-protein) synthase
MARDLPAKIGGMVPSLEEDPEAGFDPNSVFPPKDQRKVDRFILFGLAAAQEALAQAKWAPASESGSSAHSHLLGRSRPSAACSRCPINRPSRASCLLLSRVLLPLAAE